MSTGQIEALVAIANDVLGDDIVAAYLYGSAVAVASCAIAIST